MSCTSKKINLTKYRSMNSFSEEKIPLSWDELNVKGKSKTAEPPPAEVQCPTVRSENRCARLLGLLPPTIPSYKQLLPPTILCLPPCHYTFSIPPASVPSELCLDPAPLNLKALCYMISLNLNQVMTLAYDSLLIASAPFQSTAILRIMTLVLQMIHAMGPSLSWFCTAFRETFARI